MSDYRLRSGSALTEDAIHGLRALYDDGPYLLPVDGFGDGRAGVPTRRAMCGEPGRLGDLAEIAPDVVSVQWCPDAGRKDEAIALSPVGVAAFPGCPRAR
jgi:hypothetical protein